ncbi:MAG: hypothetical protein ACI3ZT_10660 [Candidatus Cryptobacteroides sp.]
MRYRTRFIQRLYVLIAALSVIILSAQACSMQRKLQRIRANNDAVELNRINDGAAHSPLPDSLLSNTKQSLRIENAQESAGGDSLDSYALMHTVLDPETGEMVPTEELNAAVVISRRYQVAERNGKVDLPFDILVPKEVMASRWQIRIVPDLTLEGDGFRDTTAISPVYVTGTEYREKQLKGYERYERFLSTIVSDSTVYVNRFLLDRFIERNIPQLYALKNDSTIVSYEDFISRYDVTAQEAVEHYTRVSGVSRNERRIASKGRMFDRYVKAPIDSAGVRLDTVLVDPSGDYIYRYVHTINTRKGLKYAYIALNSSIYDQDRVLYMMPRTDSIEYPISSLSHFVKDITRYKMKTIWRHQEANSVCHIGFAQGKDRIDTGLGDNAAELAKISRRLAELMQDKEFDLDSIIVNASCSPEGRLALNERLARGRSRSVTSYFENYMKHYQDSVAAERGFEVDEEGNVIKAERPEPIRFISTYTPENWALLDELVRTDGGLTGSDRESYRRIASENAGRQDRREYVLQREPYYNYLKNNIYPKLRTVTFNFNMHRKGMVEEFVQTEEVDTLYARGVQMLRDRDFDGALEILQDYDDYNAAVAFLAKDRNLSALQCLEKEENTADVCYLKAILYSRFSQDAEAVGWYRKACEQDRSYVFRGNLDPEISVLIRKYGLNKEQGGDTL